MKTTPFRELKDQYVGAPGTPEREAYEAELAGEIAELSKPKERPILFSGPMVRALLVGTKTQTRRALSSKLIINDEPSRYKYLGMDNELMGKRELPVALFEDLRPEITPWLTPFPCPYGQPGDRLWVREEHYAYGYWEDVKGVLTRTGKQKRRFVDLTAECTLGYRYLDNAPTAGIVGPGQGWYKRLARFMPRKISRILLEIVSVRVERLQDISEADAVAEGYSFQGFYELLDEADQEGFDLLDEDYDEFAARKGFSYQREWYRMLWQYLNGPGSWEANPWVWVVEFKRVAP